MDKVEKGRIGTRELFTLILILIGSKLADMTPTILAQTGKNAYWMIPFISLIVFIPSFLLIMYLLKHYETKNLIELIYHLLGKYVGFVVGFTIFLIAFTATIIDSRSYVDEIGIMYFQRSPHIIIYLVFMGVCYFAATKGLRSFASTTYMVVPYFKISMIVLVILIFQEVVFQRIFPIFGNGLLPLIKEGIMKSSIYGDLIILTMAYTTIDAKKNFTKTSMFGLILVFIEITVFYFLYCTFFDYKSIDKVAYPFHEVVKYVQLGNFFTNIETFYLSFWLLAALLRFVIYLYFTTWLFGALLKINTFKPLLLPFALVTIAIGMIPENPFENVLILRDQLLNYASIVFMILPYFLWVVAKLKGELKEK